MSKTVAARFEHGWPRKRVLTTLTENPSNIGFLVVDAGLER